ncbi:MAG: hypothetical protein AAB675_00005 [Patescibacteria group bacterium]
MLSSKTYFQVTSVIFSIVAFLHVSRLLTGWNATLAGWDVPLWVSIVGVIFAGFLAYSAFKLSSGKK